MNKKIPYKFTPREYQLPFFRAMDNGYKRAVLLRHRRTGKDKSCFNYMVKEAITRVGNYFYIFPTYSQGKKALRDNVDIDGFKTINHIPEEIIDSMNGQEMLIKLKNGSTIQIVGTEGKNIDRLVGTNPVGVVYSEYALQNPRARDLIRPILAVNGGWAVFNSTPRGKNHMYDMYNMANSNDDWFCSRLTVNETNILSPRVIDEERQSGMSEEMINQEYYCDFDASLPGAYYAKQFRYLEDHEQICNVPIEPDIPVNVYMDLGVSDSMVLWFVQYIGKEIRVIDYYSNNQEQISHYSKIMREKEYYYGTLYLPHDGANRNSETLKSPIQVFKDLGRTRVIGLPRIKSKDNAIEAVRSTLRRCRFDQKRCYDGINAMKSYAKVRDEQKRMWKPIHDWASHPSDAFSYMVMNYTKVNKARNKNNVVITNHASQRAT